ncbi:unnamed protein product [Rhizoctonia solani]|uniref:Uncharacterized protein n=1 Tax=Rhizoctonia solani TaxID=456999 RepID=A0A8H3BV10_9AGAM|nr:unnamed protein product [Rhizoctonia solani]
MSLINSTHPAPWIAFGGLAVLTIHWLRRPTALAKLPVPPGGNWLFGHFKDLMGPKGLDYQGELFSTYGPTTMLRGIMGGQILFTIDPAVIHAVQIKDKNKFHRAKVPTIMARTVFGGGLFALSFKRTSIALTGSIYANMPIFMGIAKETTKAVNKGLASPSNPSEVNVFPWATAAALDLIGKAGLGHSFNSFSGEQDEYSTAIKKVTQSLIKIGPLLQLLPYVHRIGTPVFRRWVLDLVPFQTIQNLRRAIKLQNEQAEEIIRARLELVSAGSDMSSEAGRGRDIMTLLMKANESEESEAHIDRQEMVGHMNIFIFAGHETTSATVTRILDILAQRPDVQVRLREELSQYFKEISNESHHDALLELPYLDGIVREVLRLFPPVPNIPRVCVEDTAVPLEYPIDTASGKVTSVPIKKGTFVFLNTVYFNRNKAIWGESANEFLPERWIESKIDEVTQTGSRLPGVYSSMMTFGAGSYACIGFKFAVMEISSVNYHYANFSWLIEVHLEVMLAELITNFKFEPADEECTWVNIGVGFPYAPYAKKDMANPDKSPKFFLKVARL